MKGEITSLLTISKDAILLLREKNAIHLEVNADGELHGSADLLIYY